MVFLGHSSPIADRKLSSTSLTIIYPLIISFIYQFLASKGNNFEENGRCSKERASEKTSPNKAILAFPVNKLIAQLRHPGAINAGAVHM